MDITQVCAKVREWLLGFGLEDVELECPEYEDQIWTVRVYDGKKFGSVLVADDKEKVIRNLSYPLDEQ